MVKGGRRFQPFHTYMGKADQGYVLFCPFFSFFFGVDVKSSGDPTFEH